jgi:hypothetical protein
MEIESLSETGQSGCRCFCSIVLVANLNAVARYLLAEYQRHRFSVQSSVSRLNFRCDS